MVVAGYLLGNVVFAALYLAGGDCIENARPGSFADAFFFSVQTMSTIGYGGMAPKTPWAHFLVTLEALVGLLGFAVATGLMFAKFSRPTANVLFSQPLIFTRYEGRPAMVFRVANARGNEVIEANLRVSLLRDQRTAEGDSVRRLTDLKLMRERTPVFFLSWFVVHFMDADSPFADIDVRNATDERLVVICSLTGLDSSYGQTVHARHLYDRDDFRFDERFVDVISDLPDGRIQIDYRRFHDTEPQSDHK